MENNNNNKLYKREERISFIYRHLLLKDVVDDSNEAINSPDYGFSTEQIEFINEIIDNLENLEDQIKKHVPDNWDWSRFNVIEKSLLINAVAEINLAGNKKAIVIDESIEYSKIYCGEKAAPLINGLIDKITQEI